MGFSGKVSIKNSSSEHVEQLCCLDRNPDLRKNKVTEIVSTVSQVTEERSVSGLTFFLLNQIAQNYNQSIFLVKPNRIHVLFKILMFFTFSSFFRPFGQAAEREHAISLITWEPVDLGIRS